MGKELARLVLVNTDDQQPMNTTGMICCGCLEPHPCATTGCTVLMSEDGKFTGHVLCKSATDDLLGSLE